jgi:hypothetical protein
MNKKDVMLFCYFLLKLVVITVEFANFIVMLYSIYFCLSLLRVYWEEKGNYFHTT